MEISPTNLLYIARRENDKDGGKNTQKTKKHKKIINNGEQKTGNGLPVSSGRTNDTKDIKEDENVVLSSSNDQTQNPQQSHKIVSESDSAVSDIPTGNNISLTNSITRINTVGLREISTFSPLPGPSSDAADQQPTVSGTLIYRSVHLAIKRNLPNTWENVDRLRKLLYQKYPNLMNEPCIYQYCSDQVLRRFLIARKNNLDNTEKFITECLKWRLHRRPDLIRFTDDSGNPKPRFRQLNSRGACECYQRDKWNRPIVVVDNSYIYDLKDDEGLVNGIILHVERAIRLQKEFNAAILQEKKVKMLEEIERVNEKTNTDVSTPSISNINQEKTTTVSTTYDGNDNHITTDNNIATINKNDQKQELQNFFYGEDNINEDDFMSMPGSEMICKSVIFFNVENWSFSNNPSLRVTKEMINIFTRCYPETLGHCIVWKPPRIFKMFYETIKPFIDPVSASKIQFIVGDTSKGSTNDVLLCDIIGDDWRSKCRVEGKVFKEGHAPGFDEETYAKLVQRQELEWMDPHTMLNSNRSRTSTTEKKIVAFTEKMEQNDEENDDKDFNSDNNNNLQEELIESGKETMTMAMMPDGTKVENEKLSSSTNKFNIFRIGTKNKSENNKKSQRRAKSTSLSNLISFMGVTSNNKNNQNKMNDNKEGAKIILEQDEDKLNEVDDSPMSQDDRRTDMCSISTSTSSLLIDAESNEKIDKNVQHVVQEEILSRMEVSSQISVTQKQINSIMTLDLSVVLLSTSLFSFALGFCLAMFQFGDK